ncbi:MAG: S1 RNA-binding domain-containing protein [Planctomycetota bacterium]
MKPRGPIRVVPKNPAPATASTAATPMSDDPQAVTVKEIRDGDVIVDASGREGIIDTTELTRPVSVGESFEAWAMCPDRNSGAILMSMRPAGESVDWNSVKVGDLLQGEVVEAGRAGLRLSIGGVRGFIPAAQIERGRNLAGDLRKTVRGEVTVVNAQKKELTLGRTGILKRRADRGKQQQIARFQRGQVVDGKVANMSPHGAFIDLGGIDGLLHISKIERQKEQQEDLVLDKGTPVTVVILHVDAEQGRIGLGFPREESTASATPRGPVSSDYEIGDEITGMVKDVRHDGAFVLLDERTRGFLPAAEFDKLPRTPTRGQVVRASVSSLEGRIELTPIVEDTSSSSPFAGLDLS